MTKLCEQKGCIRYATWQINTHAFGAVTFTHYYCDQHFSLHIDSFKLEPAKDIVRITKEVK